MIAPRQDYMVQGKMDWHEFFLDATIDILSFAAKWTILIMIIISVLSGFSVALINTAKENICPLLK